MVSDPVQLSFYPLGHYTMLAMKTFFGARVAAWVIAIVAFGLLVIEPRGWDWVAYAFGLSVLLVALTGLFAVPVALTQAALLAIAALLAVSVWLYIQRQSPDEIDVV